MTTLSVRGRLELTGWQGETSGIHVDSNSQFLVVSLSAIGDVGP